MTIKSLTDFYIAEADILAAIELQQCDHCTKDCSPTEIDYEDGQPVCPDFTPTRCDKTVDMFGEGV